MIVDTSAVLAVLLGESDAQRFDEAMARAVRCRMSAVGFLEAAIVLESRSGPAAGHALDGFLQAAEIELVPVNPDQARAARLAWRRFGKGNHPAGLRLRRLLQLCAGGRLSREPLLFKGDDFARTDIEAA